MRYPCTLQVTSTSPPHSAGSYINLSGIMQRVVVGALTLFLLGSCAASTREWSGKFARGLYSNATSCGDDEWPQEVGTMNFTKVPTSNVM